MQAIWQGWKPTGWEPLPSLLQPRQQRPGGFISKSGARPSQSSSHFPVPSGLGMRFAASSECPHCYPLLVVIYENRCHLGNEAVRRLSSIYKVWSSMPSPRNAMSSTENTEETFRQDFFAQNWYKEWASQVPMRQVVGERKMLQATQIIAMKP